MYKRIIKYIPYHYLNILESLLPHLISQYTSVYNVSRSSEQQSVRSGTEWFFENIQNNVNVYAV